MVKKRTYIRLCTHGNSLRALPKGVLDIDIVQLEVARPDSQGRSEVVVRLRFLALRSDNRDLVRGVLRVVLCVAEDCQWPTEFGDVNLL